jgi:CheY-like chemotaxis protein
MGEPITRVAPRLDLPTVRSQLSILVADDYPGLAELVAEQIESLFDVQTVCATDGLEALRIARSNVFDAIVLDLDMPGLSGVQVATALRASVEAVPCLIAMTGGGPTLALAVSGLFDHVLIKPVSLDTFARVLKLG